MDTEVVPQVPTQINNAYALLAALFMPMLTYWRTRVERQETAKTRDSSEENLRGRIEALEVAVKDKCATIDHLNLVIQRLDQQEKIQDTLATAISKLTELYSEIKSDTSYLRGAMSQLVPEKDLT